MSSLINFYIVYCFDAVGRAGGGACRVCAPAVTQGDLCNR